MIALTKEQAFAAAKELRTVVAEKEKANALFLGKFPEDRMPANVRHECKQRSAELALLTPVLAFLESVITG